MILIFYSVTFFTQPLITRCNILSSHLPVSMDSLSDETLILVKEIPNGSIVKISDLIKLKA